MSEKEVKKDGTAGAQAKAQPAMQVAVENPQPEYNEKEDIKENKIMAMLAYLLFFLPLVTEPAKHSRFARFHANQSLVFWIFCVAIMIVTQILNSVFYSMFWENAGLWFIISLIFWLIYVVVAIAAASGMWRAYKGKWKRLPLIGRITIIKMEAKKNEES